MWLETLLTSILPSFHLRSLQLFWRDIEAFPSRLRDIISLPSLGSAPRPPPSGTCVESNLSRCPNHLNWLIWCRSNNKCRDPTFPSRTLSRPSHGLCWLTAISQPGYEASTPGYELLGRTDLKNYFLWLFFCFPDYESLKEQSKLTSADTFMPKYIYKPCYFVVLINTKYIWMHFFLIEGFCDMHASRCSVLCSYYPL